MLKAIQKTHSLKKAAEKVGLAEKTAQNYVRKIESRLSKKIVESTKGGKDAGGSTKLNLLGKELIEQYENVRKRLP